MLRGIIIMAIGVGLAAPALAEEKPDTTTTDATPKRARPTATVPT